MHIEKITYKDYNKNERTEDFYFNLNTAEVIELLTTEGDYTIDKALKRISQKRNGKEVIKFFKNLIYMAYGEVSLDGRKFIKTEEVKNDFMQTEAYAKLFTDIVTDGSKAAEFINKILPEEMQNEVNEIMKKYPDGIPDEVRDYLPGSANTANVIDIAPNGA